MIPFRKLQPVSALRIDLNKEAGIQTVELALTLPLVLFIIFGTIDVARIVAAYSSVRTATAIGTRQAVGELRSEPMGVGMVMGVGDYYMRDMGSSSWTNNSAYTTPSGAPPTNTVNAHYRNSCNGGGPLTNLYRYEARALAWANLILYRNSPKASYPCDPAGPAKQCFSCCILRGSQELYEKIFSLPSDNGGLPYYAAKFVGIQCTQMVPMTTAMIGLGLLDPFVAVTANAYIPVSNYAGNHFDVITP